MTSSGVPSIDIPHLDKLVHFGLYFMLCWLLLLGFLEIRIFSLKLILVSISIVFLYGILIEFLQAYMNNGRSAEVLDAIANLVGAIFAGIIIYRTKRSINS